MSKSASREELSRVFSNYVDFKDAKGKEFITGPAFIKKFIGFNVSEESKDDAMPLLTRVVDTTKDGLISFEEFCAFEKFLTTPDVSYRMAFRMFDATSSGFVTFEEFKLVYSKTAAHQSVPFDFDCEFVRRHFGPTKKKELSYTDFTQMLNNLQLEHLKQAFEKRDREKDGTIFPLDLQEIMSMLRKNALTPFVSENLVALAQGNKISYSTFLALNRVLTNLDVLQRVFDVTLQNKSKPKGGKNESVSKDDFMKTALEFIDITPLEVELLFSLVALDHESGQIKQADFDKLFPMWESAALSTPDSKSGDAAAAEAKPEGRSVFLAIAESVYRFALGSIAGSTGATAVYPIDLVKTRLQNQRSSLVGEVMYKNFWDCFFKVIKFEGYLGLYRGLPPQLVGVAPEKAIKLTMNDFVRGLVQKPDGSIPLWGEIVAGGTAGGCQVVFTNPLEIVKIRLQVAGEVRTTTKVSAISVIRELGFTGLYKGSRACFLRDIPFSAIYFPLYANLKKAFQNEEGKNSLKSLFTAGVIAGIPAPFLTTPADVIKTRLQVKAREGHTTYTGVIDCARKILAEEGPRVFWRGANQRVFRSAPQFGVTLLTYELLQKLLPVNFGGPSAVHKASPQIASKHYVAQPHNPDHIGGLSTASLAFAGMESKFGLFLPKFSHPLNSHFYKTTK